MERIQHLSPDKCLFKNREYGHMDMNYSDKILISCQVCQKNGQCQFSDTCHCFDCRLLFSTTYELQYILYMSALTLKFTPINKIKICNFFYINYNKLRQIHRITPTLLTLKEYRIPTLYIKLLNRINHLINQFNTITLIDNQWLYQQDVRYYIQSILLNICILDIQDLKYLK